MSKAIHFEINTNKIVMCVSVTFFMLIDILPWSVSSLLNNILKGAWSQFHHKMKNIETKTKEDAKIFTFFYFKTDRQAS